MYCLCCKTPKNNIEHNAETEPKRCKLKIWIDNNWHRQRNTKILNTVKHFKLLAAESSSSFEQLNNWTIEHMNNCSNVRYTVNQLYIKSFQHIFNIHCWKLNSYFQPYILDINSIYTKVFNKVFNIVFNNNYSAHFPALYPNKSIILLCIKTYHPTMQ